MFYDNEFSWAVVADTLILWVLCGLRYIPSLGETAPAPAVAFFCLEKDQPVIPNTAMPLIHERDMEP